MQRMFVILPQCLRSSIPNSQIGTMSRTQNALESKLRDRSVAEADEEAESNLMSGVSSSQIEEEEIKVRKCVQGGIWAGKMSGRWAGFANYKTAQEIECFVLDYKEEFGKLPEGLHEVGSKTVQFLQITESQRD